MNNPKTPSDFIMQKASEYKGTGVGAEYAFARSTMIFLDLLHSQGKLSMPDLPSNQDSK